MYASMYNGPLCTVQNLPCGTWPCGRSIHLCSEGADISGPLQDVVLVEHQTRNPDAGFIAADQHWTDKVCCVQLHNPVQRLLFSLSYTFSLHLALIAR